MKPSTPKRIRLDELPFIHPNAAGFAPRIGASEMVVAVPADRDPEPVRVFATFTADLRTLVAWLVQCGIDTAAMESTGIYWAPVFELLEQPGLTPYLVNARHVKTVPGPLRETDWNDAQWLQKLHRLGLLQGSFRPDAEMRVLRTLLRHRAELIERRAPPILHMQQALKLMNLPLSEVLSDMTGVTGQAILRAIVAGERDPLKLAQWRNPACKSSEDEIAKALTGTWRDEQLFILQPMLDLYDYYTAQISECDTHLERQFTAMKPRFESDEPLPSHPPAKPGSKSKNKPSYDARAHLLRITGVDLVGGMGISASIAQTIIAEIGTDMRLFPTVKHFCAWRGLAPHNDTLAPHASAGVSGGRVLRSRTLKVVNRATQASRSGQAAQSVARSDSACGADFRSMRARLGPQQATVATAHKIARIVYHLLKHREVFQNESAEVYERQKRERELKHLNRRAHKLGYTLAPVMPAQSTLAT
jgi:transposase